MTTIQLSAKMDLDLGHWRDCDFSGVSEAKIVAGSKARVNKFAQKTACFSAVVAAVSEWLEQGDTFTEKMVGYGLCGLTLVYMTGHFVKALFS